MTNRRALTYTALSTLAVSILWDLAEFVADRQTFRDTGWLLVTVAIYGYLWWTDDD